MCRIALNNLRLLLIVLFFAFFGGLSAQKMNMLPGHSKRNIKKHPYTSLLREPKSQAMQSKSAANYEKLLVILVEFQEEVEDDPYTTGNGLFEMEADPEYLTTIAAAPHDREYFEYNLEAMRYYYQAASAGSYDLEYDVWPKDKTAYSLPHKMGYYHPPNVSSANFVSLMEEYFRDAFETADRADPQIDFSSYAHYMIIHAGSDWQHDVFGDTPSDIPSFFIRVSEEKAVSVNDGAHKIFHACNVPETISQDFQTEHSGGITFHSGYGALNGVMFHEFGHSLGLVDLYNVYNFYPAVGVFDIMDSGGSAALLSEVDHNEYVEISGILPALPGAFSRALLFEDDFRARGLMKDISEYEPDKPISIAASAYKQSGKKEPTIIKLPIGDSDYFLIENRNIDPDKDDGVSLKGALDYRVALYPTITGDEHDQPTYEYDFTLPSFQRTNMGYEGGGLLVWYVNEEVLYHEGSYLEDGSFWSNFDNNSVNRNFDRLGVMVVEADGFRDIGNPYSMFWTGTQYEYFHAKKPLLDENGLFIRWSNEAWAPRLSASTKPALIGHDGVGTSLSIDEISNPDKIMSFVVSSELFEAMQYVRLPKTPHPTRPIRSNISNVSLPYYGEEGLHLVSLFGEDWMDLMGGYDLGSMDFDYPLQVANISGGAYPSLYGVMGKTLVEIDFSALDPRLSIREYDAELNEPLVAGDKLYLYNSLGVHIVSDERDSAFYPIEGIRALAAYEGRLIILKESEIIILDSDDFSLVDSVVLPASFTMYQPLAAHFEGGYYLFLISDDGDIYRYDGSNLTKLFSNPTAAMPTNLGIYQNEESEILLFFAVANRVYLMRENGMLKEKYPLIAGEFDFSAQSYPKALGVGTRDVLYFLIDGLGYIAVDASGTLVPEHNLSYHGACDANNHLYYDALGEKLYWYYGVEDSSGSGAYIHLFSTQSDPVLFAGKYSDTGSAIRITLPPDGGNTTGDLITYVYPNPVKQAQFRIRVENAKAKTKIKVFDISGKLIYRDNRERESDFELEIDSSKMSAGVYLLQVESGKLKKQYKFAVEK